MGAMAHGEVGATTRGDWARAGCWSLAALAARWPLVARAEGILDHDQAVVGLMALDIARGRRWPIYFDGQRYMGAIEGYVAAFSVSVLGPAPWVVALAPLLFFALLVAAQYLVWRGWRDRATGHLAALFTVVGGPMLASWGVIPRGGYVEVLAWALPTLFVYRRVTAAGRGPLIPLVQAAWGFLLALGQFVNPLSWIVYATLAIDWTFGRHGADMRQAWKARPGCWLDRPFAPAVWLVLAGLVVVLLGLCVHVNFDLSKGNVGLVYGLGRVPREVAALGAVATLLTVGWVTGSAARGLRLLAASPAFAIGAIAAQAPMLAYQARVALGWATRDPSLTTWVRAPWAMDLSPVHMARVLDFLVGCRPRAALSPLIGQGVPFPPPAEVQLEAVLNVLSPLVTATVLALVATVAWRDRHGWRRLWSLRGRTTTRPTILATLLLLVALGLFRLQGSSFDGSSVRYLLPAWVVLPGLIATGLRLWPRPARWAALTVLLGGWGLAQANLVAVADRPSPLRPIVEELDRLGARGIVAQTPAALLVADLSDGRIGAMAYQPDWPRLAGRYADRVPPDGPVICVVDRAFPWPTPEHPGWTPTQDLGLHIRWLDAKYPGRVRELGRVDSFEIWEVALPREDVLAPPESLADRGHSR
jgi:hypothetical protein